MESIGEYADNKNSGGLFFAIRDFTNVNFLY